MPITKGALVQIALRAWAEADESSSTVAVKIVNGTDVLPFLEKLATRLNLMDDNANCVVEHDETTGLYEFTPSESDEPVKRDYYSLDWHDIYPYDGSIMDDIAESASCESNADIVNDVVEHLAEDCCYYNPICEECGMVLVWDDIVGQYNDENKRLCASCHEEDEWETIPVSTVGKLSTSIQIHKNTPPEIRAEILAKIAKHKGDDNEEDEDDAYMFEDDEIQPASVMAV